MAFLTFQDFQWFRQIILLAFQQFLSQVSICSGSFTIVKDAKPCHTDFSKITYNNLSNLYTIKISEIQLFFPENSKKQVRNAKNVIYSHVFTITSHMEKFGFPKLNLFILLTFYFEVQSLRAFISVSIFAMFFNLQKASQGSNIDIFG